MFDDSGQSPRLSEMLRLSKVEGTNTFAASGFTHSWHMPLGSGVTRPSSGNYPSLRVNYDLRGTQINFSMDRLD
jgi:hypothetical protein